MNVVSIAILGVICGADNGVSIETYGKAKASWQASAQAFLQAIRDHWQIENDLHWVLDVAFREDDSRIRKDRAPQNMALLRHIALNLLKQDTATKVGIATKRQRAGWDNHYLQKIVCS